MLINKQIQIIQAIAASLNFNRSINHGNDGTGPNFVESKFSLTASPLLISMSDSIQTRFIR